MTRLGLIPKCSLRRKRHCQPLTRNGTGDLPERFGANPCYLFAYGTLLTGTPDGGINQLVKDFLRPRCRAYIHGRLHDLGTYPGAVLSDDRNEKIFGQVFNVGQPKRVLPRLDAYEGYHPQYPEQSEFVRRTATATRLPGHRPLKVWIYYYNWDPRAAPRLRSGDYLAASGATARPPFRAMEPPPSAPPL